MNQIPGVFLISVFGFLSFRLFLPKPSGKPQPPAAPEVQKITIPCPTDAIFCQNAKPIVKDGRFLALGLNRVDIDQNIT